MKRRDLLRAGVVLTGAAAALRPAMGQQNAQQPSELTPAQSGVDASKDLSSPNWKPAFLDEHQNETLIILSDLIIPATDTPGAKDALVNRYIDLLLSAEPRDSAKAFLNSLAFLDGESIRRFKAAFRYLPREEQDAVLHGMAYPKSNSAWTGETTGPDPGHGHFELLKGRISMAFYSSEIGERSLGWDGAFAHGPFQGCDHSEGNHK